MANANNPHGFNVYRVRTGTGIIPVQHGLAASTFVATRGDPLELLTTGLLDVASATSTTIHGVCNADYVSGTAQQNVEFIPASTNVEFEGQAAGSALQTVIGQSMDISGTTGAVLINQAASSVGVVRAIAFHPSDTPGNYARLIVKFVKSSWEAN